MRSSNMKKVLILWLISIFATIIPLTVKAERDLDEMTKDELILSLDLGKHAPLVKKFQAKEATRLINEKYNAKVNGCNIETMRNGEVIIITIPSDLLFLPNDTLLMAGSDEYLMPIRRYLKSPDMYRVLLVMHTDDTGSDVYTDNLSLARVDAIFGWFDEHVADTTYLFPTASGASEPLPGISNNSAENRAKNRRLEVYLIPGTKMLGQAKTGRIAF